VDIAKEVVQILSIISVQEIQIFRYKITPAMQIELGTGIISSYRVIPVREKR
jgi:hypothetical protein